MNSADPTPLGKVLLIAGKEEFLNERAVTAAKAQVRAHDPQAEFSESAAAQLTMATLGEMAAPSLFSSTRCVVVTGIEDLPDESTAGLLDYAANPAPDVALVVVHGGGQKGTGLLAKLRKLPTVQRAESSEVKPSELPGFVASEVRRFGTTIDKAAAGSLIQAVGHDLRALSAAARQLTSDFPGERLSGDHVQRYFGGRAEAKSFAVADAALFGRRAVALEELRWAIDAGTAPVLVTSAFASGVRGIAKFIGAPRGMREGDLAREVGVPPWKLRTIRDQARGWEEPQIARAMQAVAQADADVKGAASDASYALERLVLTVAELRGS